MRLLELLGFLSKPFHNICYTIAENGRTSQEKDSKLARPERTTRSPLQKPSQLPGLRASFLNSSEEAGLTSASLHQRSYSCQEGPPAPLTAVTKPGVRKFVSYKTRSPAAVSDNSTDQQKAAVTQPPRSRKWLAKRVTSSEEKKSSTELECLNQLRLTNKMILEQHSLTRQKVEPSLATIPQDSELCEDCTAETEEDSGIFTSSHSKYSLEDEMIESDDPPLSSPRDPASKETRNFSSDSEEMCSRETSPMQLLADLLRRPADTERRPEARTSLVQLRKQQFEEDFSSLETSTSTRRSFAYQGSTRTPQSNIDFTKISNININNIPQHLSASSQSPQREEDKSPHKVSPEDLGSQPSQMESSLVSNTSRLSVCTDCTGSSEENDNKFFDDDYKDQQQLILNSEEEQTYEDSLFDVVDGLLQGEGNNQLRNDSREGEGIRSAGQVQVQRVKEILEEESERERKVSVDTLSSVETDICMLDLEDG